MITKNEANLLQTSNTERNNDNQITRIAVIESEYARDTQIYSGDPATIHEDPCWLDNFLDVKYANLFVGIYRGCSESAIKEKAAEYIGVHSDTITLYDPEDKGNGMIVELNCPEGRCSI